jgi:septum formation protein
VSEVPARLVLASGSSRRFDLLAQLGIRCEQIPADIDETPHPNESAAGMVERLARHKAQQSAEALGQRGRDITELYVIGGDTTVLCDGEMFAKPEDDTDARRILRSLSGRQHEVVSGIAICSGAQGAIESAIEVTSVWLRSLSELDITWYLQTGEHMGKAGAYAIQGAASVFVERIEGDYNSVVGLPLAGLDRLMNRFGRSLTEFAAP